MQFGRLAESSLHTGYKPKSCIDVSSVHTPINHPSRRNRFNIENDLTTMFAASENFDGFPQQAAASGSPQQVPAGMVNPWLTADMWSSTRKLVRGSESISSVERTLSRGKRDRDLESVQTLSERTDHHAYLEQKTDLAVLGECAAQKILSDAEAHMDIRNWERRNSDIALFENNRELESQRLELYQANLWADQAQREKINFCGELTNRLFQESRARNCQEIDELRRICCEETDRARQLRIDEMSMQQERDPTTVSQLLTQIHDLQNKVEFLDRRKRILRS